SAQALADPLELLDRDDSRRRYRAVHVHPRKPAGDRRPQHGHDELREVLRETEELRLRHGLPEYVFEDHQAPRGDERSGRARRARRGGRAHDARHRSSPGYRRRSAANPRTLRAAMTHAYRAILVERADNVVTITLNRPDRRNAIGPEMINEFRWALTDAAEDP